MGFKSPSQVHLIIEVASPSPRLLSSSFIFSPIAHNFFPFQYKHYRSSNTIKKTAVMTITWNTDADYKVRIHL